MPLRPQHVSELGQVSVVAEVEAHCLRNASCSNYFTGQQTKTSMSQCCRHCPARRSSGHHRPVEAVEVKGVSGAASQVLVAADANLQ